MTMNQVLKISLVVSFLFTCAEQQDIKILRKGLKPLLDSIQVSEDPITYSAIVASLPEVLSPTQSVWGSESYSKILNISYLHFTRSNPQNAYDFQPTQRSLRKSTFDASVDSIFVIHGYNVALPTQSLFFDIKDELLIEGRYNVFVVNWTNYNQGPYPEASFNAALVGFEIARFIKFLMNSTGISAESVYMIGHSLGAQVAAFTGKTTPNLGRITGLDAAGPIFQFLPPTSRLTYGDAEFVDGIHTNGALNVMKGYGTLYAYADQDFFPNGGSDQPACQNNREFQYTDKSVARADSQRKKISCNHDHSVEYFIESINGGNCNFLSVLCNSYMDARLGNCKSSIITPMGFHAKPIPSLKEEAMFYLETNAESPYCIPRK